VRGRRPSPLDDSGGAAMPNESVARLQGPMRLRWSDAQARIDGCWPRGGAAGSSARRGRRPGGRERRPRSRSACVHAPDPDGDTPPAVSRAGSASRSPADPRQLLTSPDPRLWRNLVDAHGSGPCGLTLVEVRVLSAASMPCARGGARDLSNIVGKKSRTRPRHTPGRRHTRGPGHTPAPLPAYSQPRSSATRTASPRLRASSFCITEDRWLRTVPGDRYSAFARSATVA
jgi:hypothetical protein